MGVAAHADGDNVLPGAISMLLFAGHRYRATVELPWGNDIVLSFAPDDSSRDRRTTPPPAALSWRARITHGLQANPRLIVLDEPASALDVSVQAQIMKLLPDLQDEYQVSYLLVAHNLATVRYLANQVR